MKPFAESSEQNKKPILSVIERHFDNIKSVLEIGGGTGQHAVYFAAKLAHLTWHISDQEEYISGIKMWMDESALNNIAGPLLLNVNQQDWPLHNIDAVFSANTAHIMDWLSVENMFKGIAKVLNSKGIFCLYGPFNYKGSYTSESNARFDQWLKQRDPQSGIRDFEALQALAEKAQLELIEDNIMPENNRILVWQKM